MGIVYYQIEMALLKCWYILIETVKWALSENGNGQDILCDADRKKALNKERHVY